MTEDPCVRVCIISAGLPPYYGGAELRAYRQAERLHQSTESEVLLISWDHMTTNTDRQKYPQYVFPVTLRFRPSYGIQNPLRFTLHLAEILLKQAWLLWRLRKNFDILHVINAAPFFNLLSIPLAKKFKKTVVLEMTLLGSDDPVTLNKRSLKQEKQIFPHQPLKYKLFLKADAYVSKSEALSQTYIESDLSIAKLAQIPSGVDVGVFNPPTSQERKAIRSKLRMKQEGVLILYVGGFYEQKGIHRLLEAFRVVSEQYQQTSLWIVGPTDRFDKDYIKTLHEYTQIHHLTSRVTFVQEHIKNIDEYMKASDILAHPSSREGMSNVILEAMSTGLAIIASDIPEIANSQINNGTEGILVSLDGTQELIAALSELISDPIKRVNLGIAARYRAINEFSQEIVDKRYLQFYRNTYHANREATKS